MGVLNCCTREGCDNIMCDYTAIGIGYICNDCKDEFINKNEDMHPYYLSAKISLDQFMGSTPSKYNKGDSYDINKLFHDRNED